MANSQLPAECPLFVTQGLLYHAKIRSSTVDARPKCDHSTKTIAAMDRQDAMPRHTRRDIFALTGRLLFGALGASTLWSLDAPAAGAEAGSAQTVHGMAMHGHPLLPPGFPHLPFVNPDAPKGGGITFSAFGTFDSLNPLIVRGVAPIEIVGLVYESLLARNGDEPFTLYGLVAESLRVPEDRSWIVFNINPKARFSDGHSVTAEDVVFSWELLRKQGRPYMRSYYGKVKSATVLSPQAVRFDFGSGVDREIPMILGLMPVLPKHLIDAATFNEPSLAVPIGSGPYTITAVDPGNAFTFQRNPDYWGRDLPIRRGFHNAETLRYLFFRDSTAQFEALKSGKVDILTESDPGRWVAGYNFPAVTEGRIIKLAFPSRLPAGMTGLVFNTRREKFSDQRVRQAITLAFDSQRINKQFFHDRYVRSESYFARSSLASTGKPASPLERKLLAPFPDAVWPEIMAGTWHVPESTLADGNRANLRRAYDLLSAAGYTITDGRLVHPKHGQLAIEFLVLTRSQARICVSFAESLRRLGIEVNVRQLEDSQYWARIGTFEFDMIQWTYPASLSPGNEQIHRWTSKYADVERSLNFAGVKNPAVDAMIEALLSMKTREDFVDAVRALDRVLLSGNYVVPLFHLPEIWIAASSRLDHPKTHPLFGTDVNTWWIKPGE